MSKSKNKSISKQETSSVQGQDSLIGLFARIFWSLLGNIILVSLAAAIYKKGALFSGLDVAFWVFAFLIPVVRYFDIKYLKGVTFEGQPATLEDWRKYVKYFSLFSVGIWLVAHIVSR